MEKVTVGWIIKTSVVTAFTLAAALIWKDFIDEFIRFLLPSGQELLSKFIAAATATVIIVVIIYLILKAEYETEHVFKKLNNKRK